MKIALFGATGRVGRSVLDKALASGHTVTVLVRTPEKLPVHDRLTVIQGDARDEQAIYQTISGMNVVFSALGTDKTTTLTESVPHMIQSMKTVGITRIVTIGTAGILESRIEPGKLRYESTESHRKLTFAAEEHHRVYDLLNESKLDWTIVCPTYLPDGDEQGNYRVERDYLPENGKQISVGDTGAFAFDELLACKHVCYRVGIAY
ncbi:SDR family oxidoreductase [Sporosarcina oncorhynchi]|uniref:SDR family oxidoreductase n=1 Tax=Sporosarcina oncorhynchi TaxID=3056444 RepID=A0ABZ0L9U5_9BACL|nr:SDR family oxidoreductase [Sporosarcina sp. T2O-4]WOV89250.1 SDR family oxidoreductase [Sporosarcina sp. T2O-4]